jgi:hypothetical protein
MAARLNDFVECGELINRKSYSTHGWLKLRGVEQPLVLELTGNCARDLAGWHIRFESRGPRSGAGGEPDPEELAEILAEKPPSLAPHQIGPTGDITAARQVKVADCSVRELHYRCKAGEPPPFHWKRCLYLEWYSQNGRVVIELVDPIIEYVDFDEIPGVSANSQPGEPWPHQEEEPAPDVCDHCSSHDGPCGAAETDADDPYHLFPNEEEDEEASVERMMAETELMDDLIENSPGEPIESILDLTGPLPSPDDLGDAEVEPRLKGLLGQLALLGIALHVCEHFTPRDTYRLLRDKLLTEERAFPELVGTGWVTNLMTAEYCPQCEADADREYEEYERKRKQEAPEGPGTV